MARMPGATWRPLGSNPAVEGTMARYDILCFHTMVGSLWGTDNYFHQNGYGGTESHFGVGYDGQILQWQDTAYRADANLDGVDRVLSVETADYGPGFPPWSGSNVPAWTAAQIEANARIAAWAHKVHGIPLRLIPNTAQTSKGLGWHRQGIDPWRCVTCERWSGSAGKVCPGDRRIAQMSLVLARAIEIVVPPPDLTPRKAVLMFVTRYGSTQYRLVTGDRMVDVSSTTYDKLKAAGVPAVALDNAQVAHLQEVLVAENLPVVDEPEPPSP